MAGAASRLRRWGHAKQAALLELSLIAITAGLRRIRFSKCQRSGQMQSLGYSAPRLWWCVDRLNGARHVLMALKTMGSQDRLACIKRLYYLAEWVNATKSICFDYCLDVFIEQ